MKSVAGRSQPDHSTMTQPTDPRPAPRAQEPAAWSAALMASYLFRVLLSADVSSCGNNSQERHESDSAQIELGHELDVPNPMNHSRVRIEDVFDPGASMGRTDHPERGGHTGSVIP